jgi:hypothetical protein
MLSSSLKLRNFSVTNLDFTSQPRSALLSQTVLDTVCCAMKLCVSIFPKIGHTYATNSQCKKRIYSLGMTIRA